MNDKDFANHDRPPAVQSPIPDWPPEIAGVHESIAACIKDGSWGKYSSRFQDQLAEKLSSFWGCQLVRLCSSGTIAVELALRGLGVRPGDEVLLAGYDFPGNFRAIEAIGAKPVLIDIVPGGWTISADALSSALSSSIKAVVVSHMHGQLADIEKIVTICRDAEIPVVEDACQVPGATVIGRRCGSMGDVGVLSFGGSKLLTSGRGGAVLTDREDVMQRIAVFADRGNDSFPVSQLQCAALLPQLDVLDEFNARRLKNATRLQRALSACSAFQPLRDELVSDDRLTAFYKFPFQAAAVSRDELLPLLQNEGIPIDSGFRGFAKRSKNRCRSIGDLPNSIAAAEQTMLLHHPTLLGSDQLIDEIITGFLKAERHFGA